jgi:succinate-semialdehyde dehydrogenase / glutarate-semialdehyde dehydrogenase
MTSNTILGDSVNNRILQVDLPVGLENPGLWKTDAFVDGAWVAAHSNHRFKVKNPATGDVIAEVADLGAHETHQAIDAAARAFHEWRETSAQDRAACLRRWADEIIGNREDLARILSAEVGRSLAESRNEIDYGVTFVQWFAEEARRVYGDTIPSPLPDRRFFVLKEPIGVVAAITPWNAPHSMVARKCSPALAAGCAVVLKPAEQTPLSALALASLAERAGFPKGVLNIVTCGDPIPVSQALTGNEIVRKVSFTGSSEVGRFLARDCAPTLKRLSLELGGNAPFILFEDGELEAAIEGAMHAKFRVIGQNCVGANRFYVHESRKDQFTRSFKARISELRVGPPTDETAFVGPVIDEMAVSKLLRLVDDATGKGARVLLGGGVHPAGRCFFAPTLLVDVNTSMDIVHEEIFGPVATVQSFTDEDDVVQAANATPYGLAAYFYTKDIRRAWRVAERLEVGMVGINVGMMSSAVAPFGGVKQSGYGREGSKYGLDEFLELKYVCMGGL